MTTLPQAFGDFELVRHLGSGGMGDTYEALHTNTHGLTQRLVVKILRQKLTSTIDHARFEREAMLCLSFEHPAIVRAYSFGKHDGRSYITMALVPGVTLEQLMGTMPPGNGPSGTMVASVATEIASALAYAHERGVLHRDISPSNIMLSESGEPKLLDFGVARPEGSTLTGTGLFIGKWGYAAPETLLEGKVSPASDVYQFGVSMCEFALSRRLFPCEAKDALAVRKLAEVQRQLEATDTTSAVREILLRCLEVNPEERYANGSALYEALYSVLPRGVHALELAEVVQNAVGSEADPSVRTEEALNALAPFVDRLVGQFVAKLPPERRDLADDLRAEAQIAVVEAKRRFDPDKGDNFEAFAAPKVRGAIVDGYRRLTGLKRRAHEKARRSAANDAGNTGDWLRVVQQSAEEHHMPREFTNADRALARRQVVSQLHKLPDERHRTVLKLVFLEGLPGREVADRMGITPQRVSQLKSDAVTALQLLVAATDA